MKNALYLDNKWIYAGDSFSKIDEPNNNRYIEILWNDVQKCLSRLYMSTPHRPLPLIFSNHIIPTQQTSKLFLAYFMYSLIPNKQTRPMELKVNIPTSYQKSYKSSKIDYIYIFGRLWRHLWIFCSTIPFFVLPKKNAWFSLCKKQRFLNWQYLTFGIVFVY